jgi:hypothetical protein
MRKARGGPIQTIAPAFDGLQLSASCGFVDFPLRSWVFSGLPARRCLSPPGGPHFPHSQEGYGASLMLRCPNIYLTHTPEMVPDLIIFWIFLLEDAAANLNPPRKQLLGHFKATNPTKNSRLQNRLISRNPTWLSAVLSSASVHGVIRLRRLRSLSSISSGLNPFRSLKS